MTKTLVIVESPTKAKTIRSYLPKGMKVLASMGHVRDLPSSAKDIPAKYKKLDWAKIGIDVESDFAPLYLIPKTKKKVIKELKDEIKNADELILATDEDREGESISWHLLEVLKPKIPVKRMVFHEITPEAIKKALAEFREINQDLVKAQETRRILDRLVGYTLSPLLWKKIAYGLSAGRVQSVCVRELVLRERERRAFKRAAYWDLKAKLQTAQNEEFFADLIEVDSKKIAQGKDFDPKTGKLLAKSDAVLVDENKAKALIEKIGQKAFEVTSVEQKQSASKPQAPFITSTLQQEANRKLNLSGRDTMRVAQSLYEKGFITYMRTDSIHLSDQAITAARNQIKDNFGEKYLNKAPRKFKAKSKNAQEAHEAIRPAGNRFKTPSQTGLSGRDYQLYDLIYKRTLATQMPDAQIVTSTALLHVEGLTFRASGRYIEFDGFYRVYSDGNPDAVSFYIPKQESLPPLQKADVVTPLEIKAHDHMTQPPARYTEASLIKKLDEEGVGRPSTYATIIGTIIDRGYAVKKGQALVPTFTGFAVCGLLEKHFPDLVNIGFTAQMEDTLDEIAAGQKQWLPYLKQFYLGDNGLNQQVKVREDEIEPKSAKTIDLQDAPCGIHIGRFGAYVEMEEDGGVVRASLPDDLAPADLDLATIEQLIEQKKQGPSSLGVEPESGLPIYLLSGRYGPYLQLGLDDLAEEASENTGTKKAAKGKKTAKPKRVSIPRGLEPDDLDFETALKLIQLPRTLGLHPETNAKIAASIGRFGPFIVHDQGKDGKDYRSVKNVDQFLNLTLEEALEILKQPKGGRGRRSASKVIKELGTHPKTKKDLKLYQGPYGYYIKNGRKNIGLPKKEDIEAFDLKKAVELIEKSDK